LRRKLRNGEAESVSVSPGRAVLVMAASMVKDKCIKKCKSGGEKFFYDGLKVISRR
jgi:hypothetical protein